MTILTAQAISKDEPRTCTVSLKEWAVAVRAMDRDGQVLLLRKGGIREPNKAFSVAHEEFLLFPTYEHQREDLLKPAYHEDLRRTLVEAPRGDTVTITHFARVAATVEVKDPAALTAIDRSHVWTEDYAEKRLHWKPRRPLAVILARLYRIKRPQTVPVLPEYGGCTSWVDLKTPVALGRLAPVMEDESFTRRCDEVRAALEPYIIRPGDSQ